MTRVLSFKINDKTIRVDRCEQTLFRSRGSLFSSIALDRGSEHSLAIVKTRFNLHPRYPLTLRDEPDQHRPRRASSGTRAKWKNCIEHPITSGNLTLNLCTSRVRYESGDTVNILFLLTNIGPDSMQISSMTGGVFVTDPTGRPTMRLQIIECLGNLGNCVLPAQSSRTITARWNTSDPLAAATMSGTYTIHLSFTACPINSPCVETVDSQLPVTIVLTDANNDDQ